MIQVFFNDPVINAEDGNKSQILVPSRPENSKNNMTTWSHCIELPVLPENTFTECQTPLA